MKRSLLETSIDGLPVRSGKVRDVYDLGDQLLMVSTDRISAFDWVLPTGIPDKGRVLTQLSQFWFQHLKTRNHLISMEIDANILPSGTDLDALRGRSMLVHKCQVVPIECVVRGYLAGSGWKEYQQSGKVCGISLAEGLRQSDELPAPIFTPATKAESGHDINISFEEMIGVTGGAAAEELRRKSIELYQQGAAWAREKGIIIADTKFEWGYHEGELILIDEALTPDSSRFWPAEQYEPGRGQPSFDKQFVRDWLSNTDWDKNSPPPPLPEEIVVKTREKYIDAYEQLTGTPFAWK
ncbi:MAG: phosphoribosylaminoimidazolesuccinocarboxamide synthase [Planctomycetota bacterium]